jgi:hypothetical protein
MLQKNRTVKNIAFLKLFLVLYKGRFCVQKSSEVTSKPREQSYCRQVGQKALATLL